MPTKLDDDTTDDVIGINDNNQETGDINKYINVTVDQEPKEIFTNTNVTDDDIDAEMGLNDDSIFKIMLLLESNMIPQH